MNTIISLADRRPKSTYVQLVDAGFPRSEARALTDYVRECTTRHGESRAHAVERVKALRPVQSDIAQVPA
jgi:hypothetical protein